MKLIETVDMLNHYHGPSGDERDIAAAIERLAAPFVDESRIDTMGNLILRRRGTGPKVMLCAHMDSAGLVVTHPEEKGFFRVGRVGGLSAHSALHATVRFRNGTQGIVCRDRSVALDKLTVDDLYLDIGAASAEAAAATVRPGDMAVFVGPAFSAGERLIAPHLGGRLSCAALLSVLERVRGQENDLYAVFAAQEEVGLRGIMTAAYEIAPDVAVVVDATPADDELGSKHEASALCGAGAAIKVMDASAVAHPQMVARLTALAEAGKIPFQRDVIRGRKSGAGPVHTTRGGLLTGGVSIPCRYLHTPAELADRRDAEAVIDLLCAFAQSDLTDSLTSKE